MASETLGLAGHHDVHVLMILISPLFTSFMSSSLMSGHVVHLHRSIPCDLLDPVLDHDEYLLPDVIVLGVLAHVHGHPLLIVLRQHLLEDADAEVVRNLLVVLDLQLLHLLLPLDDPDLHLLVVRHLPRPEHLLPQLQPPGQRNGVVLFVQGLPSSETLLMRN